MTDTEREPDAPEGAAAADAVEEPLDPSGTSDDDSTDDGAGASDDGADAASTTTPRSSAWIAWTVAAVLAVVAAVAVVQWQTVARPAAAVDEAATVATQYVLTLSTWDAGEGLEPTYASLVRGATDAFVPEIDQVFGTRTRQELVAIEAVSTGTIEDVLRGDLQTGDPDSVEVVVVVEQFVVTGPTADPLTRTERVALLRMVRADTGDARWLVDDLEMLSELQLPDEDLG